MGKSTYLTSEHYEEDAKKVLAKQKFSIGQRVYLDHEEFYVIGAMIKFAYNSIEWEYFLGRSAHADRIPFPFTNASDVTVKQSREDKIKLPSEELKYLELQLEKSKSAVKEELEKINKDK